LVLLRDLSELYEPLPVRDPIEWAVQERKLPDSADTPGPLDHDITPYVKRILESFEEESPFDKIIFVCGSQMSKTEATLTVMGKRLHERACPIIYVGPSEAFVRDQFEPRVKEMLENSSALRPRWMEGQNDKKLVKQVSGVQLRLAYAGSTAPLKSSAAGLVIVDERDGMSSNIKGEGDPVTLVEARGDTYADFKLGVTSTPTEGSAEAKLNEETGLMHWEPGDADEIGSPIWRLWQGGTRHEWAWPCPHCTEYFVPRLEHLYATCGRTGELTTLTTVENSTGAAVERSACMVCPDCGGVIEEKDKEAMNAAGVYVSPGQSVSPDGEVTGDEIDSSTGSFWVSGLCSPFRSFGNRAKRYYEAKLVGDEKALIAAMNTGFGELYSVDGGEALDWQVLQGRALPYQWPEIPAGVQAVTCGVDIGAHRIHYVVRGWGMLEQSWLLKNGTIEGQTAGFEVWEQLYDMLISPVGAFNIGLTMVDAGFRPGKKDMVPVHRVYEFAKRHARIRAARGRDKLDKPFYRSIIDITVDGKLIPKGAQIWNVDTDHYKTKIMGWLRADEESMPRFRYGLDPDEEYFRALTSEARVFQPSGKPKWIALRRGNHYLDCEMLATAAADMLKVNLLTEGEILHPAEYGDAPTSDDDDRALQAMLGKLHSR